MKTRELVRNIRRYGIEYGLNVMKLKSGIGNKENIANDISELKKGFIKKHPEGLKEIICENYESQMGTAPGIMDIENPKTFTEYIQWSRVNGDLKKMAMLADKVSVKEWAANKIGSQYIIPSYGKWDKSKDIIWTKLPDSFVIKCNHGCGMNIIVKDKKSFCIDDTIEQLDAWMKVEYEFIGLEMHYGYIKPAILAEKYIKEVDGALHDYKIHCFEGKPLFTQVIDRDYEHHSGSQKHYDNDWNDIGWHFEDYPTLSYDMECPRNWGKMLEIAQELSKGFHYVRVDLYNISGQIYLGEMTFTPRGGYYPYHNTWTRELDKMLGEQIRLK